MAKLVTGTGRCGTTWAFQVIESHVSAGHQTYRHEHSLGETEWPGGVDVEVSFEAAPSGYMFDDVVMLWRPCLDVSASWLGFGVFCPGWEEDYNYLYRAIEKFTPKVLEYDYPPCVAAKFWVEWNKLVLLDATHVFNINGLEPWRLLQALGIEPKGKIFKPKSDTNARNDVKMQVDISEDDLSDDLIDEVADLEEHLMCYDGEHDS